MSPGEIAGIAMKKISEKLVQGECEMKIVVDEMPKRPEECCFHEFDFYERIYTCGVPGNYGHSCVPNCCKCLIAIREVPDDIDRLIAKFDEIFKEGAK